MAETVFVLGSGFSKDIANYPVLSELADRVLEYSGRVRGFGSKEFLGPLEQREDTLAKLCSTSLLIPSTIFNIEHLMTYLFQDYPWRNEKEKHLAKAGYYFIAEAIERFFFEAEGKNAELAFRHHGAKRLIEFLHESKSTIITFNYDTLIERLFKHHGFCIPFENLYQIPVRDLRDRSINSFGGSVDGETLKLLKLHGSVNWYYSGRLEFSGEQLYYADPSAIDDLTERNKRDLTPLIIPSLLDKSAFYFNGGIKTQWQLAKNALARADLIYIIGYSLPETDLSARFLFQEVLEGRDSRLVVVVKEESMEESKKVEERYLELIPGDIKRFTFQNIKKDESSVNWLVDQLNNNSTGSQRSGFPTVKEETLEI